MQLGTLPDWLMSLFTLVAVTAAVAAGIYAKREHEKSQEERERVTKRDRRRDANLVHAWIERCSDAETDSPSPYVIRLINGTSSPIFDILVSVCINEQFSDAPGQDKTWTMLPPGKFEVRKHRKFPWAFPFDDCDSNHAPQFKNQHFRVTALRFTDAAGVQWIRENASLREA